MMREFLVCLVAALVGSLGGICSGCLLFYGFYCRWPWQRESRLTFAEALKQLQSRRHMMNEVVKMCDEAELWLRDAPDIKVSRKEMP